MQKKMPTKTAFITGASSGIGRETAYNLAAKGFNLILVARRLHLLEDLKEDITRRFKTVVSVFSLDVTDKRACEKVMEELDNKNQVIDVLLNNAGLALGLDSFDMGHIDDWEKMIDTNLKGLLYVTKYAFPLLSRSRTPHIINISSIAGKETYANGNVYCAVKHAVDSLSKAMRIDLLKHGFKVTNFAPGAVETEFSLVRFKQDIDRAKDVYKGFTPLKPEDIAHIIGFIVTLPPHININDILVMPTQQASAAIIDRKK